MRTLLDSLPHHCWIRRALRHVPQASLLLLVSALPACNGGGPPKPTPSPTPEPLGPTPVLITPTGNEQAASDTPTFTVRNALNYDQGQATYTFRLTTVSGQREIASGAVPAGLGRTSAMFAAPLPRGMTLAWSVMAQSAASEVSSCDRRPSAPSRWPARRAGRPYAKSVVDSFLSACSQAHNKYNDPREVLGPPDAGGAGPDMYFGFMSLGEGGYVTVDMESCAQDLPGADVRVYQSVSQEPVTLYASGSPTGPFELIGSAVRCGTRLPGVFSALLRLRPRRRRGPGGPLLQDRGRRALPLPGRAPSPRAPTSTPSRSSTAS